MRNRIAALVALTFLWTACSSKNGPPETADPAATSAAASSEEPGAGAAGDQTAQPQAGHSFLHGYVELLRVIAAGLGGNDMIAELDKMGAEAAKHKEEGKLGEEFSRRYARLVNVTKLILTPDPDGKQRPGITEEINSFVKDVEGKARKIDPNGGLAEVGPTLADEVLNLYMLLDGTTDREAARKKYLGELPE